VGGVSTTQASSGSNSTLQPTTQAQGAYQGSVAHGTPDPKVLSLTVEDAIKRGLQYNLGAIGAGEAARQARAQRLAAAAQMLPDIFGNVR